MTEYGSMTDAELAREWRIALSKELPALTPLTPYGEEIFDKALTTLLASVRSDEAARHPHPASIRFDEAKFFYDALKEERLPFHLVELFSKRIADLKQAAKS